MKIIAVIPARLASRRLPRKVLREIAGKTMLERVVMAVRGAGQLAAVIVATDSEEVMELCHARQWECRMTNTECRSGTDRVREVAKNLDADVYVNVQGDEPLARAEHLDTMLTPMLADESIEVATLATPCKSHDIANPNAVKVVTDVNERALYFSRSTIPHDRDGVRARDEDAIEYKKHLGFYAYRKDVLQRFYQGPESTLERSERLEQLRFLENGVGIHVSMTPHDTIGVDTEDDLQRVEALIRACEQHKSSH